MPESGAVPSQDGAGRGPDGEGLAAAPDEKPESQHQLEAALQFPPLLTPGPRSRLRLHPPASFRAGGRNLAVQWKEAKLRPPHIYIRQMSHLVTVKFEIIPQSNAETA